MRLFATGSLLGAIGLSLLLFACPSPRRITIGANGFRQTPEERAAARQQREQAQQNGGQQTAAGAGPLDLLNQVEQTMNSSGFNRVGNAIRNSNLAQTGLVAYAVDGRQGQCYVAVALANTGANLDMVVIGPRGTQLGSNTAPDPYPFVRFCAQNTGRHLVRLQLLAGTGEIYYALYQGQAATPDLYATLGVAQQQAAPVSQTAQYDNATQQRLAALDQRLSREGYRRADSMQEGPILNSGENRRYTMQLQGGFCYAFATLAGPGARDTDLALIGSDGNNIETDNRTDADAMVQFCPPAEGAYTLRTRLYDGNGPVFVASWVRRNQQVQATNTNTGSDSSPLVGEGTTSTGVGEDWGFQNADLLARGYRASGTPQDAELSQGATHQASFELAAGSCYAFLAVGAGQISDVQQVVSDGRGREVARDLGASVQSVVRYCAASGGNHTVALSSPRGGGPVRVGLYQWNGSTDGPFGLSGLGAVRFHEVSTLLQQEGFEPDANVMPGSGRLAREGQHAQETIELDANICVAVVVIGGDGVENLDVTLNRRGSAVSADSSQDASPAVRYCTSESGDYEIDVEAAAGAGEYHYLVYSREG